jgi:hypothetical protein
MIHKIHITQIKIILELLANLESLHKRIFYLGNPNIEPISLSSFFKGPSYDHIYHFDRHSKSLDF